MQRLQLMAGSLLLLRAANADEEAEDLLEDLMSGGLLDGQEENDYSTGARGNESTGSDIPESSIMSMPPGGTLSVISWQPSLESGNGPHAATRSSTSKTAQILHTAFGNNALARRGFCIDLFTVFTKLCVIVKLLVVRGNDWFSATGMFLVLGWLAVQTLLIVLHARERDESDMKDTVRTAARLEKDLSQKEWWWDTLFLALHLPFFGYPCYLAAFHPWVSPDAKGFLWFLRGCAWFLDLCLAAMVAKFSFWAVLWAAFIGWCGFKRRKRLWKTVLFLVLPIVLAWLLLASMPHT